MRTLTSAAGNHSLTREAAEPFAIQSLRATFLSYPAHEQARIRNDVIQKLRDELRSIEFKRAPSALFRLAGPVYGITREELR